MLRVSAAATICSRALSAWRIGVAQGSRATAGTLIETAAASTPLSPPAAFFSSTTRVSSGAELLPRSLTLSSLSDNPGAHKKRKRKGRGPGSGMGKTAGRGTKGKTARSGGSVALGFEGGQTPLWRRTPKIGQMLDVFRSKPLDVVTLAKLQLWIDTGRVDPKQVITTKTLVDSGLVTKTKYGVKLLGTGSTHFSHAVKIEVAAASASAIAAVEALGGTVKSVYYTPLALRSLLKPAKFDLPIKAPRPPPKKMAYYTSFESRGYLSPEVQLRELKTRLAAGEQLPQAAALHPVFVGGPVEKAERMGLAPASHTTAATASSPPGAVAAEAQGVEKQ